MTPRRVQMTRHKPWRAEHPDAVIVDRRSKWGNPYRITVCSDCRSAFITDTRGGGGEYLETLADARAGAVDLFGEDMASGALTTAGYPTHDEIRAELAGRDLACWCPLDGPCHADVLLEIANGGARDD